MDERNERIVFKRIVENSVDQPNGKPRPQYFLITPKLLQVGWGLYKGIKIQHKD